MKQSTDAVLVSVIIPAYNCAAYIDGAIESALQQDVPLEIIIIDDCSKDNLQSHILRYADNPQITYVRNERNMGVSASRNRGIEWQRERILPFWTRMTSGCPTSWPGKFSF